MTRGELDTAARNSLLAQMTDEVGTLVLTDNYRQNQAISVMGRMSVARLGSKQHFIQVLERKGRLDRALEYLPTDTEFTERKAAGLGLTRPELSVLLSYSKMVAFEELLNSDVPEDPYLSKELMRYFPSGLQERYGEHMQRHRLRREIIATAVTNSMVNRMGATFLLRMQEDTGRNSAQIAKAYSIAREVFDARALWAGIDALDSKVDEAVQVDALLAIWSLLCGMTRWLLNRPGDRFDIADAVTRFKPALDQLRAGLSQILSANEQNELTEASQRWVTAGVPDPESFPDAAYNMGLDPRFDNIAHTSSTVTIEWFASGPGWQGGSDESWAIDDVEVKLNGVASVATNDSFTFTVSDGADGTIGSTDFVISVNAVDDAPTAGANLGLTLAEGGTAVITSGLLQTNDVDNTAAQLIYTVTNLPTHGTVNLNGAALAANRTFTQADLDAGRVGYTHDSSENFADNFKFTVSDGGFTLPEATFALTITPVNDAPTVGANLGLTLAEGATAVLDGTRLKTNDVDNTTAQVVYAVTSLPISTTG